MVTDYFTKWTEAFALPDQKAEAIADCLVTQVFCRFGVLWQLHSDQAAYFESKLIEEISLAAGPEIQDKSPSV